MDMQGTSTQNSTKRTSITKSFSQHSNSSQNTNQKRCLTKTASVDKDTTISIKKSCLSPVASLKEDEMIMESKESLVSNESKGDKGGGRSEEAKVIDIYGVRISPAVVRFDNTFENQSYMETVSVQNISDMSVTVRIYNPRAWSFRVTPLERGHLLAPGLKVCRCLHYTCTKNGIVHSTLPIYINENVIELPLEACKGQAFVEITPTSIQFGRVDISCKQVGRKIQIKNVSFCATKFIVDLGNNELDLQVSPMKGWIRPHSSVTVILKLMVLREGIRSTELWITTDLCQARIRVEVEACRRSFVVIHPNTVNEFTLVDFPSTFYGCRRYQTVVVYNMAASTSAFVILSDYGSKGQEPFEEAKKGAQQHVKMFDIEPVEGKIRPFEKRIFTFWFNPKMIEGCERVRKKSNNNTDLNDYLCTVRIKRIQVDDSGPDSVSQNEDICSSRTNTVTIGNSQSNYNLNLLMEKEEEGEELSSSSLMEDISVLLYLYGEAEVPSLSATPDALYFPNTSVGTTVVKVVQLTNNTNHSLTFKYSKIPFFEVSPDLKKLSPKTAYDVTVKLCARNIGVLKKNLTFEILAEENATDHQNLQVISDVTVRIFGEVISQKIVPKPKFNPGITPVLTHEVGFLTDDVTFASEIEKPRCTMTVAAKHGRPWHQTDATIAFPNDRPLTLRPRPTDATAKTIYKGLPRNIVPVDESQTFTIEKLAMKKVHDDWFLKYLRGNAAFSTSKDYFCEWNVPKVDLDPPLVLFQEKELKLPREVFVPLTFVQLYRIRVYPALISFGSVSTSKSCSQLLSIFNDNDFKISAKIMPLTSEVYVQTLEHFIISKKSEAKVLLTFQREILGRYSGTITCIINGFHSYDIAVVAEVVHRSLTITPEYVEIKIPDIPFADLCVPVAINNPLNIPITFSWVVPDESPIKIEPIHGVSPKLGTVWCGVYFEPESPNYKLHPLRLVVEGTFCLKFKTGVILPKTNVYFLESVLNIGYIPMNIITVRRFTIFNPDFSDAMFVVLNKEPIKGVKVKPSSGSIKAKSCHSFSLQISIPLEKVLDFTLYMTLQNSATIEMKVIGNVVCPEVEVTPKYIHLHRVPCNSVTRTSLTAENRSKAKAEVGFNMDEYPQFKISLSKRHHDPGVTSCGFTLKPGAVQKFYLHFIPKDLASYDFYLPIVINSLNPFRGSSNKDIEGQGRVLKSIRYQSSEGRKNSLNPSKKLVMSHLVLVNVVVLKATLVFSDLKLFFSSTSEIKSFSVTNVSEQPIGVFIHAEDSLGLFDFFVDKEELVNDRSSLKLVILPGDTITYNVIFTAISPGLHISDMAILTTTEEHCCVYNTVRLTGNIPLPCIITSSVKEIYFQPVPLNVEISFIFYLNISNNQQNKETVIGFEITNPHMDLFTIEFPKGNVVAGATNSSVPVKITFQSSLPVSLRKQIIFKDTKYTECFVTVIATADNCLLTTHAFLKARSTYQPRLKMLEDVTEKQIVMENEKMIPPKQQTMQPAILQTKDSSSVESGESSMSLRTISSISQTSKTKGSFQKSHNNLKHSTNVVGKERKPLSHLDTDELSFLLSEKEEKVQPTRESFGVTEIVTKEDEPLTFPMFPLQPAVSEHSVYMKKTLNSVEQWVYEQVFCCSYNPVFGSHSFCSFSIASKKDYSLCSPVAVKNVFDALERICGRRIRRFFTPIDKLPEDKMAKALFTYNLYQQLVEFMVVQGALMAHVEPKYLMVYDEYCNYHRSTMIDTSNEYLSSEIQFSHDDTASELMSAEKFQSISTQCWLDLFLQMFKVLVLGPAVGVTYYIPQEDSRQLTVQSHDYESKMSLYGRAEEVLLTWLTHQYNTQRTVVWPNKSPPPRTVTNFDLDLEDGLVLTATTAAYCPFLNQIYFYGMCLNPSSISQAYHNTTCLCMAWGSIKLGFSITPRDFVHSNMIKMLLLVTHLYKILPSYKPEATITFRAILNASESQVVTLENDEEVTITYHVEILPHSSNFFLQDCQNSFVLKRKSKGLITVQYMARNTNKAEAILLLCGACMPPKFGRNYVFKLEGYPIKLPVSSSFNIIFPQNIPMDTQITIESPHMLDFKAEESYSYDLWLTYTEPQPGNINALCWAKERNRKMPRRLFFTANTLVVTLTKGKIGSGILAFKVCCYSQVVRDFWLIFRNPDIGDFIVKLQVTPRRPEPVIQLQVTMNQDIKCICTTEQTFTCNRATPVKVPCRNLEQWSAVRTMFELSTSPEEKEFWATYIESNIGFRLLQWMLEEKKEILHKELEDLFKKSKTYKVSCPSKYVSCTPTIHIPDVRCNSSVPLELHLDVATPSHSTVLTMTSIDGFEVRCYMLNIVINITNPL